ncbi:MAG TPA: GRP family sugar transporter [Acidobacteriaceae bacterium]|nr:GRP family sugar transporter [Acidobacteriaceae bacterium]
MMIVHSYPIAVALCMLTMVCWGSWANTLKMEPPSYGFSLFYWDQAVGYLLLPLLIGLTFGSFGVGGRSLLADLQQGSASTYAWAILGGVVFNLANILFMSALDVAGMAVAYPIGIGIALVEGVLINYIAQPRGNPILIFTGVGCIMTAIILDGLAYRNHQCRASQPGEIRKGVSLALAGGILMGLFYYLVLRSVSPDFHHLARGKFGPYAAVLIYSAGSLVSNLVFNSYLMSHPFKGAKVTYSDYFGVGTMKYHAIGALGGVINGIGVTASFVASKAASPAIAYGLGQGGTMIAAIWGVFVWKECKGATAATKWMISSMFVFFLSGLVLLVRAML